MTALKALISGSASPAPPEPEQQSEEQPAGGLDLSALLGA